MTERVLSTRRTADGLRRRRYESADGTRYWTIEMPEAAWLAPAPPRRAMPTRAEAAAAKVRALAHLAEGRLTAAESAAIVGVATRTVQIWRVEKRGQRRPRKNISDFLHIADMGNVILSAANPTTNRGS